MDRAEPRDRVHDPSLRGQGGKLLGDGLVCLLELALERTDCGHRARPDQCDRLLESMVWLVGVGSHPLESLGQLPGVPEVAVALRAGTLHELFERGSDGLLGGEFVQACRAGYPEGVGEQLELRERAELQEQERQEVGPLAGERLGEVAAEAAGKTANRRQLETMRRRELRATLALSIPVVANARSSRNPPERAALSVKQPMALRTSWPDAPECRPNLSPPAATVLGRVDALSQRGVYPRGAGWSTMENCLTKAGS